MESPAQKRVTVGRDFVQQLLVANSFMVAAAAPVGM
jgi:hypothetical protein